MEREVLHLASPCQIRRRHQEATYLPLSSFSAAEHRKRLTVRQGHASVWCSPASAEVQLRQHEMRFPYTSSCSSWAQPAITVATVWSPANQQCSAGCSSRQVVSVVGAVRRRAKLVCFAGRRPTSRRSSKNFPGNMTQQFSWIPWRFRFLFQRSDLFVVQYLFVEQKNGCLFWCFFLH